MNTVLCCMLGLHTCCAVDALGCYQVKTFLCSEGQQMGPSSRGFRPCRGALGKCHMHVCLIRLS